MKSPQLGNPSIPAPAPRSQRRAARGRAASRHDLTAACIMAVLAACQSQPAAATGETVSVSKEAVAPPASADAPARAPTATTAPALHPSTPEPGAAVSPSAGASSTAAAAPTTTAGPAAAAAANTPAAAQGAGSGTEAKADAVRAETRQGTVVNEESFSTWLEAASPLPVGAAANIDVVLVAKAPYHTNAEYPHKFKLNAPAAGLRYPEDVVKGMQVKPDRSVLRVPVQAERPGPATVSGTLSFSVCTEERCLVEKRELSLNLEAK